MILEPKYTQGCDEYFCNLTRELDELCGFVNKYHRYRNYILDTRDLWCNCYAIIVPGRTTGNIEIDDKGRIVNIKIANELIGEGKLYQQNINEELEQYIGESIQFTK